MAFEFQQKVLFKHCDPAGIVFYPRYFEMLNDSIETFFAEIVEWPFEELLRYGGLPTAAISTKFIAPSRHGDQLVFSVRVKHLGETSLELEIHTGCEDETRLKTQSRLVRIGRNDRPESWPRDVRSRLEKIMEGHDAT